MSYAAQLRALVACFAGSAGRLDLEARSFGGVGQEHLAVWPKADALPLAALNLLRDDWSLRLAAVPRAADGHTLADVPIVLVLWLPRTLFSADTGWRYQVDPAAHAAIARALETMPAPSVLVDGGHELWAGWRLEAPLRDLPHATRVLTTLAARLGGTSEPLADLPHWSLPFAGPIRNWHDAPREDVTILEADPTRCYALEAIEENAHVGHVDAPAGTDPRARRELGRGATRHHRRPA
jgi:hypothetical protein